MRMYGEIDKYILQVIRHYVTGVIWRKRERYRWPQNNRAFLVIGRLSEWVRERYVWEGEDAYALCKHFTNRHYKVMRRTYRIYEGKTHCNIFSYSTLTSKRNRQAETETSRYRDAKKKGEEIKERNIEQK